MKQPLWVSLTVLALVSPVWAAEVSDQLEVFGNVEVQYGAIRGDVDHEYGTALSTAAVGAKVKPNDKFDVTASWLYEENLHSVETPLDIDEAYATWHALADEKLDISAGKKYLPFGSYTSAMISDPLTLQLGETRRDAVLQANGKNGNLSATGYIFEGKSTKPADEGDHKNGFGLGLGYENDKVGGGIHYMSNLAESDNFDPKDVARKIPAVSIHGQAELGRVTVIGEHLMATKSFQEGDLDEEITTAAKPSATQLEANLDLNNERVLAVAWNQTRNAEEIGLAKQFYGVTYGQPLFKDLTGAVELSEAKDYDNAKARALTLQLSYEF